MVPIVIGPLKLVLMILQLHVMLMSTRLFATFGLWLRPLSRMRSWFILRRISRSAICLIVGIFGDQQAYAILMEALRQIEASDASSDLPFPLGCDHGDDAPPLPMCGSAVP